MLLVIEVDRARFLADVVAVGALVQTRHEEPVPFAGRYADEASTFHGATPLTVDQLLWLDPAEQRKRLAARELDEKPDDWTPSQELLNLEQLAGPGKILQVAQVESTRDGVVLGGYRMRSKSRPGGSRARRKPNTRSQRGAFARPRAPASCCSLWTISSRPDARSRFC